AHSLAAEFSGHSVRLTDPGDGPDAHRRIILQIDSLQTAGERTQALAIADRAIAAWPRGPQRAELLAVRSFVGADAMDVAIALLDQALHEVGDDVRLGCLLLERRANERIAEGDLVGGLGDLRSAVERSADVTDFTFRTRLKAGLGQLELLAGSPRPDLMDDAAGLGTEVLTTDAVDPRFDVARQMLWSGDLAAARERVEILRTLAAGAEVVFPHIQALYDLSVLECAAGDLASATMWAREGAQWARDYDDPWSESHFSYPLARIDVWSAPPAAAAVAVGDLHVMADSFQTRPNMVRAHWLLGLLALREREIPEAASHLTDAVTLLERTGIVHPAPYPVLPDAIEALAVAGDVVSAQELLERLESQAEAVRSAWASAVALRARGALLLAHGDPEEALEPLAAAVDMLDSLGFQPDAARAVQARGSALLRIGHRSAAGEALSDARARFSAMGAEPWAAAATLELERVAPGRAAGELTATESRIAALVAEGRKNKEIAASLFMSVATVEAHLTRIYRKLGIGSRSDLTRLVATGDLELR
ncbi:MAG: LuxR C-terminal-related transcriptional regulator, partial [Actinomycetota bacterium]